MELAFTLILTFSGLCSFHIDDNESIWALVVNDSCPQKPGWFCNLCFDGKPTPGHHPHSPFLVINSRNLESHDLPKSRVETHANEDGEAVTSIKLEGLDLEIIEPAAAGFSADPDDVDPRRRWPWFTNKPWPWCKKDYRWTASIADLYDDHDPCDRPRLNPDCLDEDLLDERGANSCRSALAARFRIDRGTVLSDALGRDRTNDLIVWDLGQKTSQVLSEHLQVEIKDLRGSVTLRLRALPGEEDCMGDGCTITLEPERRQQEVTVGVTNLPLGATRGGPSSFRLDHFQWYYLLAEETPSKCRKPRPPANQQPAPFSTQAERAAFENLVRGEIEESEYLNQLSPETRMMLRRVPTDVFCPESRWP